MSQESRRRSRRAQAPSWEDAPVNPEQEQEEIHTPEEDYKNFESRPAQEESPAQEDPVQKAPLFPLSRENRILFLILIAALAVALVFGVLLFLNTQGQNAQVGATATPVPYDVTQPFAAGDITAEQMEMIEQGGGSFALASYQAGPHGIQIGDSLDTLLSRFPVTYTAMQQDVYTWDEQTQSMSALANDLLETDYQVIYAQRVYYQDGEKVVVPPCGTLSIASDSITVTLTAPLSPSPEDAQEDILDCPHVYCKLTLDPDTSKITRIVLGKTR